MALLIKDAEIINKIVSRQKSFEAPKSTPDSQNKDDDRKLFLLTGMAIDMDKRIDELEKKKTIVASVTRNNYGRIQQVIMKDHSTVIAIASLNRSSDGNISTITITKL